MPCSSISVRFSGLLELMQMGDVAGEGQVLQLLQGAGDFNFLF